MITQTEALDLTQYLRSILAGKMRGAVPDRCRRAATAAKATGREEDDDLIQDTLAKIVERLDDRLPRTELRAYAKETLHNIAVDKARRGMQARRHIARYAETVYGLSAPSGEHEVELIDLLEARLNQSDKLAVERLLLGQRVHTTIKKQLRMKLSKLGASTKIKANPRDVDNEELARALPRIPAPYRRAAELLIAGESNASIASQLNTSKANVGKYIFRARLIASGETIR